VGSASDGLLQPGDKIGITKLTKRYPPTATDFILKSFTFKKCLSSRYSSMAGEEGRKWYN